MKEKTKIKVEVVSDIVCPWCYLAEHNLNRAIDEQPDDFEIEVVFHPFQLNPEMPYNGVDRLEYMAGKFGGVENVRKMDETMRARAGKESLVYNGDAIKVAPNTFNGHRLIWLAAKHGLQREAASRLHSLHFAEGVSVSDTIELIKAGISIGIPSSEVEVLYTGDDGVNELKQSEAFWRAMGIRSEPVFTINNKLMLTGFQDTKTFREAFQQVKRELSIETKPGATCEDDVCDI